MTAKKLNDDQTTMATTSAGHPSSTSKNQNELPPRAPQGIGPGGGSLRSSISPSFKTAYGPKLRVRYQPPSAVGLTKQSFKAECDINNIMARYLKTGVLEHVRTAVGAYLDVTGADFQSAQNLVAGAKSMFHMLPSAIRTKFDNNPAEFLKYMENPANAPEARELGLLPALDDPSYPPSEGSASAQPAGSPQAPAASGAGSDPAPVKATKGAA